MSIAEEIADHLKRCFLDGGRFSDRYDPPESEGFQEVVPGGTWQAYIYPRGSNDARVLRVFQFGSDNAELVKAHWRNEIRVLMRLSARHHQNLPVLRDAGVIDDEAIGYLIIDDPGFPLVDDHPLLDRFRNDRAKLLRCYFGLLEAVHILHRDGTVHRTITPESVCARRVEDGHVVLDSFQMSAFVATWLYGKGMLHDADANSLRPTDSVRRAYLAPERLGPLFGQASKRLEGYGTDVFGLGMIGASWFVESVPGTIASSVGQIFANNGYDESAHESLVRRIRSEIQVADLPLQLKRLLTEMLGFKAANRMPSAISALESLSKAYGVILAWAEGSSQETQPYNLCYLPETVGWLYREGVTSTAPEYPDYVEYNEFIQRDLEGGIMIWSAAGFRNWQTVANRDVAEKAQVVLLGKAYAYFCQYLVPDVKSGADERALVVKFPIHVTKVSELRRQPLQRSIPPLAATHYTPGSRFRPSSPSSPAWNPLVESIRSSANETAETHVEQACHWLLGMTSGRVLAETYACELLERQGNLITLEARSQQDFSDVRDEGASIFSELWSKARRQQQMASLFESKHEESLQNEQPVRFDLLKSLEDRDKVAALTFLRTLTPSTAQFQIEQVSGTLSGALWVRPNAGAARVVLQRQRQAVDQASRNRLLIAQLQAPHAIQIAPESDFDKSTNSTVDTETQALLRRMQATWPLYVVQGPPGTGKTFLAANYVKALVESEPFVRVLVSAQSHHALDNLVGQISDAVGKDVLLLRIATPHTQDRVGPEGRAHIPQELVNGIKKSIAELQPISNVQWLQKQWKKMAKDQVLDIEIAQRLHRSASIICVTSNSASARNMQAAAPSGSFDIAIIEEAARGWLTEMLIPMVHANRWLIIGDQKQLPPFEAENVERAYRIDVENQVTAPTTQRQATREALGYLRWFDALMQTRVSTRMPDPRHQLTVQRRMHQDIGTLISESFYDGRLQHHSSVNRSHRLGKFEPLRDTAFLWVDTSVYGTLAHENQLTNECEALLIDRLATALGDFPSFDPQIPAIHILSPYRAQLKRLSERVSGVSKTAFATVDAVQGRQAEVVIVSLTRSNTYDDAAKGIGFMCAPERVNVMLSRARRLLIVVGNHAHFSRFEIEHWQTITRYAKSEDRFMLDPSAPPLSFQPRKSR